MKKIYFLAVLLLSMAAKAFAQVTDEQEIRSLLATQVKEWNAGHIEGYMHGYWESDSLIFIGKNGPTYGFTPTLKRYQQAYPDKAHMGQLTSTLIRLERLSPDYYFAIGKWALKRTAGDVSGSWTLLIRKIKGQWTIIVDHSS